MKIKKLRNTKKRGVLHFRVFRWNGRYLGICKETGFVEEDENFETVKKKLINGAIVVLKAVIKSSQDLEPSLNTSPPLKYAVYYHMAPVLGFIEFIKNSSKTETGFYSFVEPIPSLKFNA